MSGMEREHDQLATALQHAGKQHRVGRGVISAVEQAVTFTVESPDDIPVYQRLSNTGNHREVNAVVAALEAAPAAFVTNSGMAAMHLVLSEHLKPGDHVICHSRCYGSTRGLLDRVFVPLGISVSYCETPEFLANARDNTAVVLLESITNPFCVPEDIAAVASEFRGRDAVVVVDNTFASPVNCQPYALGADYVVESATKYMNGHSDLIAGAVAATAERVEALTSRAMYLGCSLSTEGCNRLLRGLRTLSVRMQAHNASGLEFAEAMASFPEVETVFYGVSASRTKQAVPGFGGYGGMVCLRFAPEISLERMMPLLKRVLDVPSLGGTETTACLPLHTTHKWTSPEVCREQGVDASILRVSMGLERCDDIVADFRQALDNLHKL